MLLDLNAFSVGLVACLLYVRWAFSSMVCNCRQGRVEEATKGMVCFLKEVFDSKLLAKNLLLVVTHVSQSKPALKQRQASGKSLDLILRDISMRISTAFGLPDRVPCFDIDTAPVRLAVNILHFCMPLPSSRS